MENTKRPAGGEGGVDGRKEGGEGWKVMQGEGGVGEVEAGRREGERGEVGALVGDGGVWGGFRGAGEHLFGEVETED